MNEHSPQYFHPPVPGTDDRTLLVYFTAPMYELLQAHMYDAELYARYLSEDIADHLRKVGVKTIGRMPQVRIQILYGTTVDDDNNQMPPTVFQTIAAYFAADDPEEPALVEMLANGFHSDKLDAMVEVEIPTAESEQVHADWSAHAKESLAQYDREKNEASRREASVAAAAAKPKDMAGFFDD